MAHTSSIYRQVKLVDQKNKHHWLLTVCEYHVQVLELFAYVLFCTFLDLLLAIGILWLTCRDWSFKYILRMWSFSYSWGERCSTTLYNRSKELLSRHRVVRGEVVSHSCCFCCTRWCWGTVGGGERCSSNSLLLLYKVVSRHCVGRGEMVSHSCCFWTKVLNFKMSDET